jgi:hypothetical protein
MYSPACLVNGSNDRALGGGWKDPNTIVTVLAPKDAAGAARAKAKWRRVSRDSHHY